jgi:nucleotide-binding universal stress UspA family protein
MMLCDGRFARRHDAHLTGLYVVTLPEIPPFVQDEISAEIIDAQINEALNEGQKVLGGFEKQAAAEGLAFEARLVKGLPAETLSNHARCFDLLVVGQYDPDDEGLYAMDDMPDRIIMVTGCPVLVVPYAGSFPVVGDNVIVSWDASRQASRAINDGISVLETAKEVKVLSINPADKALGDMPGADVCLHLARHGIKAKAQHITARDIDAAVMLLSRRCDAGADLIVMGAYGHARWREIALGGFTRHMLAHMTVPVLMSN